METKTHEAFISGVRNIVLPRVSDPALRARLTDAKLVYGAGHGQGARGITFFGAWSNGQPGHDFLEVCAAGEETTVQLAGTTIHELGHCLAGWGAGHGKAWKEACKVLGLDAVQAGGQSYAESHFAPEVWSAIAALPEPADGKPTFHTRPVAPGAPAVPVAPRKPRPCPLGIGTRGGKSRGTGSGSRLRLWQCECGTKVRVASDDFRATCDRCGSKFSKAGAPPPPAVPGAPGFARPDRTACGCTVDVIDADNACGVHRNGSNLDEPCEPTHPVGCTCPECDPLDLAGLDREQSV